MMSRWYTYSWNASTDVPCSFRALIAGGGAPEIELAVRLAEYSRILGGMEAYCVRAYGDALEVIPSTLAENAGLNPISTVTELRNRHAQGDKMAGINVRKVRLLRFSVVVASFADDIRTFFRCGVQAVCLTVISRLRTYSVRVRHCWRCCGGWSIGTKLGSMLVYIWQGGISNILEELVVQPLLVSISALTLATETVRSILKIDDVVRWNVTFSGRVLFVFFFLGQFFI